MNTSAALGVEKYFPGGDVRSA